MIIDTSRFSDPLRMCGEDWCIFVTHYRLWQTFFMLLVVYSAWASPFEMAFKNATTRTLMFIDLVVDDFFTSDIVLTFFVAYLDKSTYLLVDDHKKITERYKTFVIFLDMKSRDFYHSLSTYLLLNNTHMYVTKIYFPMDVASTLPFQVIYRLLTGKMHQCRIFGFLNLLRIWRLRRVSELFSRYSWQKIQDEQILVYKIQLMLTKTLNIVYLRGCSC